MSNELIIIGEVRHDGTNEVFQVVLVPPEDATAQRGRAPEVKIIIGMKKALHTAEWDAIRYSGQLPTLRPNVAESLGRFLMAAAEQSHEKWPAWTKRLIAEANPQHR